MPIETEQPIDSHLGGPHRVFDREDDIVGDFAILTDEGEIGSSERADVRTVTFDPRSTTPEPTRRSRSLP